MSGFRYKDMKAEDAGEISVMVRAGFDEFVAPGFSREGKDNFYQFTSPGSLTKLLESGHFFGIVCRSDADMAGIILVKDKNHVSLLFVRKVNQKKGISRELFRQALEQCTSRNPFLTEITVNASAFAVQAYESLGFVATGPEETRDGIAYTPMSYRFESELRLEEMTLADYDQIVKLWRDTPGIGVGRSDTRENLQKFIDKNRSACLVGKKGVRVISTILCGNDGRRGYIYHAATDQEFRGRGIGRVMVERVLLSLKTQGIERCHLFTFKDNETGNAFWASHGWRKRDDLVIFTKDIEGENT